MGQKCANHKLKKVIFSLLGSSLVIYSSVLYSNVALAQAQSNSNSNSNTTTNITTPTFAYANTLDKIAKTGVITIGHREASLPVSYYDANKQPIGYAVDICNEIASGIKKDLNMPNIKIQYKLVTPSTRQKAIQDGTIDMECGSTTDNASRRKDVDFSIPYYVSGVRMVVKKSSGIQNWSDLKGKSIVITKGTTTLAALKDKSSINNYNYKFLETNDHQISFNEVVDGQADAFSVDDILLYGLAAASKNPDAYVVTGDPLTVEPYAIMLRKNDPQFKDLVDSEFIKLVKSGEIYNLYNKWFLRPIPPKGVNLNVPMNATLRDILRYPTDQVGD